jgi:hypothetical protein
MDWTRERSVVSHNQELCRLKTDFFFFLCDDSQSMIIGEGGGGGIALRSTYF